MSIPTIAVGALSAALMLACGGGTEETARLSSQTATQYSADASVIAAQAGGALDATLLTAAQLVPGTASPLSAGRKQALATSGVALNCLGGGAATMTITGANLLEELNAQLDAGEAYQIAFINCRGSGSQAMLNGSVTMTVVTAAGGLTAVTLSTTTLNAKLPRGMVSFIGSASVQRTVLANGSSSNVTTQVSASSLTITTDFNGRIGNFTLSDVDLTRQATYSAGALLSTSYNGSHSLAGTVSGQSFNYTVATQGGATFDANGVPAQGSWVITLPRQIVTISVANGTATIGVDEGKDGSIDRSFAVPILLLSAGAG